MMSQGSVLRFVLLVACLWAFRLSLFSSINVDYHQYDNMNETATDQTMQQQENEYWKRKPKTAWEAGENTSATTPGLMSSNHASSKDWRLEQQKMQPYIYPDGWGLGTIGNSLAGRIEPTCEMVENQQWVGTIMWDELRDSAQECCQRCFERVQCMGYNYNSQTTECLLMSNLEKRTRTSRPSIISGKVQNVHKVPYDCVTLGRSCGCPRETWATDEPLTRQEVCDTILADKTVVFSGDSTVRDLWTDLAVWLLVLDGYDAQYMAGWNHHAACMVDAWKFLDAIGFTELVKKDGVFKGGVFHTCGGRTKLVFDPNWNGESFIQSKGFIVNHAKNLRRTHGKDMIWVMGGYLHCMKMVGDNYDLVRNVAAELQQVAASGLTILGMGMHYRIVDQTPKVYMELALGPQGNERIKIWNSILAEGATGSYLAVDPFNITISLSVLYDDSEDGFHFGYWIMLQKNQLMLLKLKEHIGKQLVKL